MSLFLTMFPFYLLGNLHCLGMCGPLVMMIGRHRYRYLYFLGRIASFGLAGAVAGGAGALLQDQFRSYHIPALMSFGLGTFIIAIGFSNLWGWHMADSIGIPFLSRKVEKKISLLLLRDQPLATFLFGFFTVLLPCGQSLVVFSACALSGEGLGGLCNGVAFSLLTTPSLGLSMYLIGRFREYKKYYPFLMGVLAIAIGTLAWCRGFAELEIIPHATLNADYHLVLF